MITFGNPNKKGRKWRGWGQQVPSKTLGLAGNLLDNVPQLIIQGVFHWGERDHWDCYRFDD